MIDVQYAIGYCLYQLWIRFKKNVYMSVIVWKQHIIFEWVDVLRKSFASQFRRT